jgi:hypothetical protein
MVSVWRMASVDDTMIPPKLRFSPRSMLGACFFLLFFSLLHDGWLLVVLHPSILNVLLGQPIEVRVTRCTEEDYVSTRLRGFEEPTGVIPETESTSTSTSAGMPGSFPSSVTSTSTAPPPPSRARDPESVSTRSSVNETKPMTSVQAAGYRPVLRMAQGTRDLRRMHYFVYVGPGCPFCLRFLLEWWLG